MLIDGYQRLAALRQIGKDLIWADVWDHSVDEALLLCLARGSERGLEAIEEAALLHSLSDRFSLRELAQRIGRDVSWVSRRLTLFKRCRKSCWGQCVAASSQYGRQHGSWRRWRAPTVSMPTPCSRSWARPRCRHASWNGCSHSIQKSPQAQRERLVTNPGLFVQAQDEHKRSVEDKRLAEGPEGAWYKDLGVIEQLLKRLTKLAPMLFSCQQEHTGRDRLQQPFDRTKARLQQLDKILNQAAVRDQEVKHDQP